MTRSEMREHVFKLIFRVPFHDKNELREQIDYYFDDLTDVNEKDYEYIKNKALLVCELSDELDEKINSVSEGWPVDRIGKAELAIMRLAVYEMLYDDDIPVNVAINEAVELAKSYGSDDNAASFVNGVLAKLVLLCPVLISGKYIIQSIS
jgi:transcription antitermination protein NusB